MSKRTDEKNADEAAKKKAVVPTVEQLEEIKKAALVLKKSQDDFRKEQEKRNKEFTSEIGDLKDGLKEVKGEIAALKKEKPSSGGSDPTPESAPASGIIKKRRYKKGHIIGDDEKHVDSYYKRWKKRQLAEGKTVPSKDPDMEYLTVLYKGGKRLVLEDEKEAEFFEDLETDL